MKWNDVFCHSFRELKKGIEPIVRQQVDFLLPSKPMMDACRADDFDFFQPFIDAGKLTTEQMHNAAERYLLGKTRSGQPIFWMIDDMQTPLDAHIGDSWISTRLKAREPMLKYWQVSHCLFGLHLLMSDVRCQKEDVAIRVPSIAIVESEQSAVVLSELFPECLWMAYATTLHLTVDLLAPLEGCTVTIYPRTDPTLSTFIFFEELSDVVKRQYDIRLSVDDTLERHATADQKERCIDILDFILES